MLVRGYAPSVSVPIIITIFPVSHSPDFVQRLQKNFIIILTKPPFLPYLLFHQDRGGWNKPKFTKGMKVSLRRREKIS